MDLITVVNVTPAGLWADGVGPLPPDERVTAPADSPDVRELIERGALMVVKDSKPARRAKTRKEEDESVDER